MDTRVERKLQYVAAWSGPIFLVGYVISFGLLGHNHPYITKGPLALDGLWNFWVAFPWWLIWFAVYTFYMMRYLRRLMIEGAEEPEPTQTPVQVWPEVVG